MLVPDTEFLCKHLLNEFSNVTKQGIKDMKPGVSDHRKGSSLSRKPLAHVRSQGSQHMGSSAGPMSNLNFSKHQFCLIYNEQVGDIC